MKKRFSEEQIIKAIKQHEAGTKVEEICRQLGISNGTFYNWQSKYDGLKFNEAKRPLDFIVNKRLIAEKVVVDPIHLADEKILAKQLFKSKKHIVAIKHQNNRGC